MSRPAEAELACVAWWNTEVVYPSEDGYPSIPSANRARRNFVDTPKAVTARQNRQLGNIIAFDAW